MHDCPNMLIIGAAGRNVGKTEFACQVIRRVAAEQPVTAVKVTTVVERDGSCPRGGRGCGVCSSLRETYCITDEMFAPAKKDTGRMAAAGARHVYWLRVLKNNLDEALEDLLSRIPRGTPIVCESNSARLAVRPGLFLVVRKAGSITVKASCDTVIGRADRVFAFDGAGWDFQPHEAVFSSGRWFVQPRAAAIILAGGRSRRMGRDKSLLDFEGQPLIQRIARQLSIFPERLISTNEPGKYAFLGIPAIPDRELDRGPLMGILSAVAAAKHDLCFVTGCDIPDLDIPSIVRLIEAADGFDIAVPRTPEGHTEPLLAVYRKTIVPYAEKLLAGGEGRIASLYEQVRVRFVDFESLPWYRNLNTPEEYAQAGRAGNARQ